MNSIVVCVEFDDLLAITLARNAPHSNGSLSSPPPQTRQRKTSSPVSPMRTSTPPTPSTARVRHSTKGSPWKRASTCSAAKDGFSSGTPTL